MDRLVILLICFTSLQPCHSQDANIITPSSEFRIKVKSILTDVTHSWKEYPTPPDLSTEVLSGLGLELKDDSALYFFNHLSKENFDSHIDYQNALAYFKKNGDSYCLLAITAHWNPDARISALISLNERVKMRPQICSTKYHYEKLENEDRAILKFLVFTLQRTPLFISGSENATIHGVYISNILWNIDLYTGENIVDNKNLTVWYKNELQYENDLLKWQTHIIDKK